MFDTMKLPKNVKAYFRRQGRIGGAKRTELLTPERRSEIARNAAVTRWANRDTSAKPIPRTARKATK
jgi:hypothetical protein